MGQGGVESSSCSGANVFEDDVFKHGESNKCSEDHVALHDEEGRYVSQTHFIIATSPNRTAHGGALPMHWTRCIQFKDLMDPIDSRTCMTGLMWMKSGFF